MALPRNWERLILRGIGAPATPQNVRFLDAWQKAEGGGTANNANFNPLNTTQGASGAGSINSVGVKSYRNAGQGIRATVQTLLNGHYGDIVSGLRGGRASAQSLASSKSLGTWGTGSGVLRVLGSGPVSPPKLTGTGDGSVAALSASSPQAANGGGPDGFKQAVTAYLIQNSNELAQGHRIDPNSIVQLALLRSRMGPGQTATTVSDGNNSIPVIHGAVDGATKSALATVKEAIGTPYVWGGSQPGGFDCSGLLQYAWGKAGVKIPRVTYDQWKAGASIGRGQLKPGDAVFFRGSDSKNGLPGHVGMYVGGGKFIEAPRTGSTVHVSNLAGRSDYMGARRYG
jgi:cell wall-associated NlpC family hydrolase